MAFISPKLDLLEQSEPFFEPQLIALGLGEKQIANQTLEELEQSRERVDEAIRNADSFGRVRLEIGIDSGRLTSMLVKSDSAHYIELGILPLLLERKRMIRDRVRELKGKEKIDNLRDLIQHIPEEEIRSKLEGELEALRAESIEDQQQANEVEQAQRHELSEIEKLTAKAAIFERRSKVWQSFLERESVATIVGGSLLIIITLFLIVAMFVHIVSSDILNNSFLVILGYFFGQSVGRASSHKKGEGG